MKKVVLIFSVLCIYLSFSSCLGDRCDIVGKWKVTEATVESEKLSVSIKELMKSEYLNTTYEFLSDGSVNVMSGTQAPRASSYSLNLDDNTLTFSEQGSTETQKSVNTITNCSDNKFSLVQELGDGGAISKVTFTIERTE